MVTDKGYIAESTITGFDRIIYGAVPYSQMSIYARAGKPVFTEGNLIDFVKQRPDLFPIKKEMSVDQLLTYLIQRQTGQNDQVVQIGDSLGNFIAALLEIHGKIPEVMDYIGVKLPKSHHSTFNRDMETMANNKSN